MKVRADEHVSPKIVQVLRVISLSVGWELTGVREFHGARTADETWVPKFAAEGGQAIITADQATTIAIALGLDVRPA